jgi:preprotein translocase subunit SecF
MNITNLRHLWFTFSSILIIASFVAIGALGFNFGLDFTGGARWHVSFDQIEEATPADPITETEAIDLEVTVAEKAEETPITKGDLESFFITQTQLTKDVQIQAAEDKEFLITIEDLPDSELQAIAHKLRTEVSDFTEISYRKVDSSIGASFKKKALYAILTALIGIILFVAFVFRKIPKAINPWRFGGVAIIALFHDILIVLGIFLVLGHIADIELDLPFITALLATLGFSVNDTIVILDRVRENIRLQKTGETFTDTIEKSIQQTLLRSINTSISTLLPLLGLLFFGAESIFYFVLALTLGIAIGTYSSIFLAAPLLVTWKNWSDAREK